MSDTSSASACISVHTEGRLCSNWNTWTMWGSMTDVANGRDNWGDHTIRNKLVFCDEMTFHPSGRVSRNYLQIRDSENSHESSENERDSHQGLCLCGNSRDDLQWPLFFVQSTVTGMVYHDRICVWSMPQLQEDISNLKSGKKALWNGFWDHLTWYNVYV
jgi:hypothetical protein